MSLWDGLQICPAPSGFDNSKRLQMSRKNGSEARLEAVLPAFRRVREFMHMSADKFTLLAQPWWVNLLILVPFLAALAFRRNGLRLSRQQLLASGIFAVAFGYVEAAVVVYIRASIGLLPGYNGTLADVQRLAASLYRQPILEIQMPPALITIELFREAATLLMLASVALLMGRTLAERWAAFLWCFAIWDIVYYAGLWATVRWPYSLLAPDVLFLIPVPWVSQVWFPLLVSALAIAAVLVFRSEAGTV
jgi:hypothetical protein